MLALTASLQASACFRTPSFVFFTAAFNAGFPSFVSVFSHSRSVGTSGMRTLRASTSGRSASRSNTISSAGQRLMPRHFE